MSPNPIPSLQPVLWYDFSDESTVTVSNSQITQINDKGSRGWALTKSNTGPQYVTGINGLKSADWGNPGHSNYLRNTSNISTNIAEIYVVLDANYGTTFPNYNGLLGGTSDPGVDLTGGGGVSGFYSYGTFNEAYANGASSNVFSSILPTINSPSLLRIKRNTAIATSNGFQTGNDRSNFFMGRGWGGFIGEVVVFSSALSSTDRTNIQNWLATKWGIILQ
jgi:hypothetical protein